MDPEPDSHPTSFAQAVALANLPIRFGVEMATLGAVAWSSWRLAPGPLSGTLMALLAPLALSVFWGAFVSPRARVPLRGLRRLVAEVLVFGAGVAGLWLAGHPSASVALGTAAVLTLAVTHVLGDPMRERGDG